MAHDLSLTYARFDHMSPTAATLAALLHGLVIVALLVAPAQHAEQPLDIVEVTVERELAPLPPPEPVPEPAPSPSAAAPQPPPPDPPVQQSQPPPLGLSPPIGTTMDPRAPLTAPQVGAAEPEPSARAPEGQEPTETLEAREEPKTEPPKEIVKVEPPEETVKSEPVQEQQQAALAPQPPMPTPAPPRLEDVLPPLEAAPPPVSSRDIPALAPPPPPPPPKKTQPQPAPKPQAPPPPAPHAQKPQQQLAPSPLSNRTQPRQRERGDKQQASRAPPSPFVNPADVYGERKAQENYLWGVVRKISQHRYYPKSGRENSEEGTVVALVTIARDGRVLGARISRSSGSRTLDNAVLEIIHQAAPYAPLPNDISGDRHTFLLPLSYKRNNSQ